MNRSNQYHTQGSCATNSQHEYTVNPLLLARLISSFPLPEEDFAFLPLHDLK
jgi:hypothetical protein